MLGMFGGTLCTLITPILHGVGAHVRELVCPLANDLRDLVRLDRVLHDSAVCEDLELRNAFAFLRTHFEPLLASSRSVP